MRGPAVPCEYEDALVLLGLALHGPVDMTLTALNWPAESNPLVAWMGLLPWLGFKSAVLLAFFALYAWRLRARMVPGPPQRRVVAALGAFVAAGAAVMLLNLSTLYGVP